MTTSPSPNAESAEFLAALGTPVPVGFTVETDGRLPDGTRLGDAIAADQAPLLTEFGSLKVLGGCCGTDVRHVAAMWESS